MVVVVGVGGDDGCSLGRGREALAGVVVVGVVVDWFVDCWLVGLRFVAVELIALVESAAFVVVAADSSQFLPT